MTSRDRGLPHHVRIGGGAVLDATLFVMTEQPRTIDRRRITRGVGRVDDVTLREIRSWLVLDLGV